MKVACKLSSRKAFRQETILSNLISSSRLLRLCRRIWIESGLIALILTGLWSVSPHKCLSWKHSVEQSTNMLSQALKPKSIGRVKLPHS